MNMNTSDIKTLSQASVFRKLRAMCRTMGKGTCWRFYSEAIRHGEACLDSENTQCPLTFVAGIRGSSPFSAFRAGEMLGLESWSSLIMRSADSKIGPKSHRRIRRILLRAAKLKEQ